MQAWTASKILNDGDDGEDDGSGGATHPCGNPLDGAVFATADGFLMVTALFRPFSQSLQDLEEALNIEGLVGDERFATLEDAKDHRGDDLRTLLVPVMASKTSDEWILLLEAKEILVAPVRSTAAALADRPPARDQRDGRRGRASAAGQDVARGHAPATRGHAGSAGGGAYRRRCCVRRAMRRQISPSYGCRGHPMNQGGHYG